MYKTISKKLQRAKRTVSPRSPKRRKGSKRRRGELRVVTAKRGVILRVIGGQQEVRLIGRSVVRSSLYLDGMATAKGARPGDVVRLYYNRDLGLWCGALLGRTRNESAKK